MRKDNLNVHLFQKETEDHSIGKILSEKKIWEYGVSFGKNGSFICRTQLSSGSSSQ